MQQKRSTHRTMQNNFNNINNHIYRHYNQQNNYHTFHRSFNTYVPRPTTMLVTDFIKQFSEFELRDMEAWSNGQLIEILNIDNPLAIGTVKAWL